MRHLVTGLFNTHEEASRAIEALLGLGIPRERLALHEAPAQTVPPATEKAPGGEPGLPSLLDALFLPAADLAAHREALSRGQFVVAAEVEEAESETVAEALDAAGALDLDESGPGARRYAIPGPALRS